MADLKNIVFEFRQGKGLADTAFQVVLHHHLLIFILLLFSCQIAA